MANRTTECGLLPFPAEIRNKIYHHVFKSRRFLIVWPVARGTNPKPPDTAAELALTRVSKATREEAMTILYAESQVRYLLDFRVGNHSPSPSLQAVNLMNTIKLDFLYGPHSAATAQTCVAMVKLYSGTDVQRERMMIKLHIHKRRARFVGRSNKVFFEALKGLKGFRTVIIEILDHGTPNGLGKSLERLAKNRLKGCLGPAIECDGYLQFHPQQHILSKMDREVARLEAKAADLRIGAEVSMDRKAARIGVEVARLKIQAEAKRTKRPGQCVE